MSDTTSLVSMNVVPCSPATGSLVNISETRAWIGMRFVAHNKVKFRGLTCYPVNLSVFP